MRKMIGIVAGLVLANLLVFGWESVLPWLPFGGAWTQSPAEMVAALPVAAQLWVVAGWALATLVGAFTAFRIGHSDWTGWVVAGVEGALCVANVLMIPHPLWMRLAAVAAPFLGAVFGFGLYRRWRAAHLHLRRARAAD